MPTELLALSQVPPIPRDADGWSEGRSHVWEHENRRWRTASANPKSTVHVYIEYGDRPAPDRAPAQIRRYTDGRF